MTHLITGGSGFLGNLISRRLHARGERVRVLDTWEDASRPKEIMFIKCDIRDVAGVANAMSGVDVVHHNVALVPLSYVVLHLRRTLGIKLPIIPNWVY